MKLARSLWLHHHSFKALVEDGRLLATARLLMTIFYSNSLEKMTEFMRNMVDSLKGLSPTTRDELYYSNMPFDLFKLLNQPVESARLICS